MSPGGIVPPMDENATPLMKQYLAIKKQHPGEILFFRLGDFYETFFDDAKVTSQVLGITLTGRFSGEKRVPMAGVPYHSATNYIGRLLRAGHKIAICEQMQDPEEAEGKIVERAVVRVITPGTLLEEVSLDDRRNNFLAAVKIDRGRAGIAWVDLSTGRFQAEDVDSTRELYDELTRLSPAECLVPQSLSESNGSLAEFAGMVSPVADWVFDREPLTEHFKVRDLAGFGCDDLRLGAECAGAILSYLKETQRGPIGQITRLEKYSKDRRIFLDRHTQRALELVETQREGKTEGTLLWVLDKTQTPMGGRLLREWILSPLRSVADIRARQDEIARLMDGYKELQAKLRPIGDLERIVARLGTQRSTPRDLAALREALRPLASLPEIPSHEALLKLLDAALLERPAPTLTEGGIIKKGFDPDLDKLLELRDNARAVLASLEQREIQRTGISSLKVDYHSVFGYYIEVTNAHKDKIPKDYIRKQTLKNAERFITAELKDLETQILNAEDRAKKLEHEIFLRVRKECAAHIARLQETAAAVAKLDALAALARAAVENNYVRPEVDDSTALFIEGGRHPVLEKILDRKFVPNDTNFDASVRLMVITGPNMAGKSTYLRQVALLTLLAQMGSFVPATRMKLGVVDRIFTRIGASDEITRGASTFMVEMTELADILNNASDRSLIVLDEVGRGTSTYDGVSIAWAACEHIHSRIGARTLFATHYHELAGLEEVLSKVKTYNAKVKEWKDQIAFLYRIVKGTTDRSYGIHVAQLAGVPRAVIDRARVILEGLQQVTESSREKAKGAIQLSLFRPAPREESHPVVEELKRLDVNTLTPLEALQMLAELAQKAKQG